MKLKWKIIDTEPGGRMTAETDAMRDTAKREYNRSHRQ